MRLSNREVKRFLDRYPVEVQEIVLEVRDAAFSAVPEAWERLKMNGIAYFLAEDSTPLKGMICHVVPSVDKVQIGFIFGAFMPDPMGLLEGDQKAKRFLNLYDFKQVPWEALEELIRAAAKVDPTTF